MSRFVAIDLSQLPPPQLIEIIDYEVVLEQAKAFVLARWEAVRATRPDLPPLDTLDLESEPIAIVLQVLAYRETILRALVNDKARAVLLAFAVGTDLDHLGARLGVQRLAAVAAPRPYATGQEDWEDDERFRRRIQLAPEAFSVAGPAGAYVFHALTGSLDIADAHAFTPDAQKGKVIVVLAGRNGQPVSDAVLAAASDRLDFDHVVPLTDIRQVRRAEVVAYDVTVNLIVKRGPDPDLIRAAAETAIRAHAAERYRIGEEVYRSGLVSAAKVKGVDNVILLAPAADVLCTDVQIPHLGALAVTATIV